VLLISLITLWNASSILHQSNHLNITKCNNYTTGLNDALIQP